MDRQDLNSELCPDASHLEGRTEAFPGGLVAEFTVLMQGALGLTPHQGTRSHMPLLKILHATTKTEDPMCHNYVLLQSNK